MLSVATCSNARQPLRKRRNDSDNESPDIKVRREEFYFVLESESDYSSSEEDTESILSLQNRSTDFAKDTSDTSSKTSQSRSDLSGVEYEVVSLSEKEAPFSNCSSGTDLDQMQWRQGLGSADEGESVSVWADGSSAPTEPDLAESNGMLQQQRHCLKCKAQTNLLQFCSQCYKVRKDFFPPRPRHCRKKNCKSTEQKKPSSMNVDNGQAISSWVESSSSQELPLTPDINRGGNEGQELCNVCFKSPKNGAFLHNRWVHIYSCYQCSLKIWFSTKCCPLCNGKIRQVLKVAFG